MVLARAIMLKIASAIYFYFIYNKNCLKYSVLHKHRRAFMIITTLQQKKNVLLRAFTLIIANTLHLL